MESAEEQALIGQMMRDGLKSVARRILTKALDRASASRPPWNRQDLLRMALQAAAPILEVRTRTVDGHAIREPTRTTNRLRKGVRAILKMARRGKGRVTASSLADAILAYTEAPPDPDRPRAASALRRA